MKKTLTFLFPFFFAIYPILELRNHNIAYVDTASIIRPILLSIVLTGVTWLVLRLLIKDWQKTSIITAMMIVAFFSYGQVYMQIQATIGEAVRHRLLILIFAAAMLVLGGLVIWKVKKADPITDFLIITSTALLAFTLIVSIRHDITAYQTSQQLKKEQSSTYDEVAAKTQEPDIYFILLDGHTRSDILKKDFDYDNSSFIQKLKAMGFYVAECAQSNYPSTKLSVSATFYGKYHGDAQILYPVSSSMVIETVRSLGYKVITFENRSNGHFDIQEDMRLSRNQMALGRIDLTGGLSEFDMMLLQTTAFKIIYDMPQLVPGLNKQMMQKTEYYEHYEQTLFILDELKKLPDMQGPKFVFAHILVPHPPYIFTPDGKYHWAAKAKSGYAANTEFIDSQIAPVVSEIIKKSKIPPVIIIMGDHGPSSETVTPEMRMAILNAYYVNDQSKKDLYETITPVNSFRVIFNNYFGTDYPLLEDQSYYSYNMGKFTPDTLVPNKCRVSQ